MLHIVAIAAILNADSVNVNAVQELKNLDSLLTAHQVVVTDTPIIVIQTCEVAKDTLAAAFRYARLYLQGRVADAKKMPGYEYAAVTVEYPETKKSEVTVGGITTVVERADLNKKKVYALLNHTEGNLPEIIFRNTGELGVLELTYITEKGTVIAVAKQ